MQPAEWGRKEVTALQSFEYILENIDPLVFSERGADNILFTTKHYVPGSAMRGALAHLYIAMHKLQPKQAYLDAQFYDFFLSGKVRFLPAYPIGNRQMAQGQAVVLPLSLMRSKDKQQIVDLAAANEQRAGYKKLAGFAVNLQGKFYPVTPKVKIELHMSRSSAKERVSGTSQDGNVYNYEYLEAGQLFKGAYAVDAAVAEPFKKFLQQVASSSLYLGRSKSAQYGKCLYKALEGSQRAERIEGKKLFLLAKTPYIAFGSWQRAEAAVSELLGELEAKIGVKLHKQGLELFAATESIDGYVGVWQAKKQAERALSAGTLIELKADAAIDGEALSQALLQGLGKNTADGYGQFVLWQPLLNPAFSELPQAAGRVQGVSEAVKQTAAAILQERLLQAVRQQAAYDVRGSSLKITEGNVQHILKRVEGLMYTDKSKSLLQGIIKNDFKSTAKNKLKTIKYKGDSLYDILIEANNHKQPYSRINWVSKLALDTEKQAGLKAMLGAAALQLDENRVYREYWLWFMRHAGKLDKKGERE